jgi:hypothetical protein
VGETSISQRRNLVDTGSAFSIMPWQSSAPPSGPNLSGADDRRILCWGERPFTVTIGSIPRQWQFLLAAVSFPILGVDFLRHHSLVVDVANLRLSSPPPLGGPTRMLSAHRRGAFLPAQAGVLTSPGGSSPPSTSPAVAAAPRRGHQCGCQVSGKTVEIRLIIFRARIDTSIHRFTAIHWRISPVLGAALAASTQLTFCIS